MVLIGIFGDPYAIRQSFLVLGIPALALHLLIMGIIVAWSEMRKQDVPSLLLGCAVTIVLTTLTHDMLQVAGLIPDHRIFYASPIPRCWSRSALG
jgi:hypothetical protein